MSFLGAMFWLVLMVFFGTIAVAVVPAYAGFWQVRSIMDGLAEREDILAKGPRGIMTSLSTLLDVNSIRGIHTNDFKLQREQAGLRLRLDYEVREHLFFNVDVLMAFDHEVLLPLPTP